MRKWFLIMATAVVLCSACGKKDASVNDATQAAQASSTEAENLYKEGSQYVGEEDYESAIESLLKCIELDPDYSKAYIQLSKAYIGNEEYDEAMTILQQGYEKTKDTSLEKEQDNCVRTICQVLTDNEDYETAIPWLLKLQELDGVTVENSLQLAEAYSMMDDYENAVSVLQKADQNDASIKNALLEARVAYGQYCYDEGKNDQAIETLKAVINEAPDRIDAYSMLISVYVDAGKVKEAESIVQSGLERFVNQNSTVTDDQLDEFLNSASSYYLELEDVDACLRFWEKAVSMRPGNKSYKEELDSYRSSAADESYAKADELLEAGDVEGASKYYKRAFALAPSNYDAGVISGGDYTYCLNKDGSWRLGWYTDETGGSYYFNPAAGRLYASAVTGYQQLDGAVYYFEDDGRMLVDDTTPDGRYAHTPVADGVSPSAGKDVNGPTAAATSVSRLDHFIVSNGTLFNQKFHPSALAGREGLEKFVALIRTYFDQKGMHMQFNVVDRATLIDAQKHPEKYAHLVVRVAGYSALFTTLSRSLQDDIIRRTEQGF